MSDLESTTRYDPTEVEPRIVEKWLQSGLFHPEPKGTPEENYSIAIPPPNVTGVLHMGHALNNSIQHCLVRYPRRQRDAGPGGARPRRRGCEPARPGARGVHRARVGVAGPLRRDDHRAAQA